MIFLAAFAPYQIAIATLVPGGVATSAGPAKQVGSQPKQLSKQKSSITPSPKKHKKTKE